MNPFTYRLIYLLVSASISICVAVRMHRNGQLILATRYTDNVRTATSINRASTLGFSLFLLGCTIDLNGPPSGFSPSPIVLSEMALERSGAVFLVFGAVYLVHLFLISRFACKSLSQPEVSNPA